MPRKEKVTRVIDGDTFQTRQRKHPVRLARVNAPEKGQRGAAQARKDLEKLILNQDVTIQTVATDNYKRAVANVKFGRNSVNKAMKEKV